MAMATGVASSFDQIVSEFVGGALAAMRRASLLDVGGQPSRLAGGHRATMTPTRDLHGNRRNDRSDPASDVHGIMWAIDANG
jgi:hypothetical protein